MIDEKGLIKVLENRIAAYEEKADKFEDEDIQELFLRIAMEDKLIIAITEAQPKVECSDCSRRSWYQKGYQDGLNINNWTSCSERLPEEDGTYLAWITCEGREYTSMEEFDVITKWNFHTFNPNDKVIAWQPLPEDYKGE